MTVAAPTMLRRHQLVGLALAAAAVPLNSTMIAVALPDLAGDFGITTGSAGVLVTIYLVVMLVGQPAMGRIIDALGGRRMLLTALIGFGGVSVATSFAPTFALVVAGRAIQAVFGAALMPSSQALLRTLTEPSQRGRSFGLLGSFIGVGAAAGPVIGGLVTQLGGWQGIFVVNAPLAAAAFVLLTGLPAAAAPSRRPGDGRPGVAATLAQRTFGAAFLTQATTTLGQYSLLLVVPIVLDGRGWSATSVGAALTLLTAGMVVMGPIGGRVGDVRGRRRPVVVGVAAAAVAAVAAATVVDTSPAGLLVAMAVFGVGLGFAVPSVQTAALESVPEEFAGSASGVLSMSRYFGSIPASVLLALLVTDRGDGATTYLAIAAVTMVAAVTTAWMLPSTVDRQGVAVERTT